MRQYKVVAISIAAVIVAVIGFFVIREIVINNTPHTINKLNATITSYNSSDLEELVLNSNGTKYTFKKKDQKVATDEGGETTEEVWYIVGEEDITIDQNVVNTLGIITTNLVAKDVIAEAPEDITKYGFTDESTYTIGKLNNGEEYKVVLGDMLYNRDGYYIMREGDTTIYSASLYTANSMLITRGNLLETNIFPGTISTVTSFELTKEGEQQFKIVPDETYFWLITQPIEFKGEAAKIDTMIGNTFELMIKEYVDLEPEDLSIYGLLNAKYELTIVANGIETKLYLGKEDIRDSSFYARIEGKEEVFTIDSSTLNFLDTPLTEVLWPFPYTPKLEYVASVDVNVVGREMLFTKTYLEDVELNDYQFNGISINDIDQTLSTFGQFYFSLLITPMITDVKVDAVIEGEPYCDMLFTYEDGNFEQIQYYLTEYDKTKCYVVRNGEYTGLISDEAFFGEPNGLAAVTDLIISGKIKEDLDARNKALEEANKEDNQSDDN